MLKGIEIAPTKKSATAMLAIKMSAFFCRPLRFFTETTAKMFSNTVMGQATHVVIIVV